MRYESALHLQDELEVAIDSHMPDDYHVSGHKSYIAKPLELAYKPLEMAADWLSFGSSAVLSVKRRARLFPRTSSLNVIGTTPPMLGIARGLQREGYRIAVRVESVDQAKSPLMERIYEEARGEVDVRVVGRIMPQTAGVGWDPTSRTRPLRIGVSVAHRSCNSGTVGLFVKDSESRPFLMSNNHVLADVNLASRGDAIFQPGHGDGGVKEDRIGSLEHFIPLSQTGLNYADCAYCTLEDGIAYDPAMLPDGAELGGLKSANPEELLADDAPVLKFGKASGVTRGTISSANFSPRIWYDNTRITFARQIEIEGIDGPFSINGDSGSLVYGLPGDTRTALGIGLLFAGSAAMNVSYASPLETVLGTLKLELAT